jgi:hypothetical protein
MKAKNKYIQNLHDATKMAASSNKHVELHYYYSIQHKGVIFGVNPYVFRIKEFIEIVN